MNARIPWKGSHKIRLIISEKDLILHITDLITIQEYGIGDADLSSSNGITEEISQLGVSLINALSHASPPSNG